MAALSLAVTRGKVQEAPKGSEVPRWVRTVVLRGLESEPEKRWPDMRTLVTALGNDPAVKRNRWLAMGGATVLVAGMLGGMWAMTRAEQEDCEAAAAEIEAVWNEEKKAAVVAAIGKALPEGEDDPASEVTRALDEYAQGWRELHLVTCEDRNRGGIERTEDALLVRVCLDRRRNSVAGLVEVLADADQAVAERSSKLIEGLDGVED